MGRSFFVLALTVLTSVCFADGSNPKTEQFAVTSPVHQLGDELGSDFTQEPFKSGQLQVEGHNGIAALLKKLGVPDNDTRTTIIHLLRWSDPGHTTVQFQKWYVYTPKWPTGSYYLRPAQKIFEDVYIPGQKSFRFLYIHLNAEPTNTNEFGTTDGAGNAILAHPVSYKIVVTQQPTQFVQDFKTILGILGYGGLVAVKYHPGYWSVSEFDSQYSTSTITITPTTSSTAKLASTADPAAPKPTDNAAQKLNTPSANTYINEGPTHWGLGFAIPVKSYKDVTYNSSNGTLTPTTITKQNVYVNLDAYLPAAVPGLMSFRYIPHPFIGLPMSGKVFHAPMAGVAVGLPWLEVYAGAIFDRENGAVNGQARKTTTRFSFGVKISVSAAAKALMGTR